MKQRQLIVLSVCLKFDSKNICFQDSPFRNLYINRFVRHVVVVPGEKTWDKHLSHPGEGGTNISYTQKRGGGKHFSHIGSVVVPMMMFINPHQTGVSESLIRRGGPNAPPPKYRPNNGFCKFCFYRGLDTYIKG